MTRAENISVHDRRLRDIYPSTVRTFVVNPEDIISVTYNPKTKERTMILKDTRIIYGVECSEPGDIVI